MATYIILKRKMKIRTMRDIKILIYIIKRAKLFVLTIFLISGYMEASGQNLLSESINLPSYKNTTLREVLNAMKSNDQFEFSYNSSLLDLDSTVSKSSFKGRRIDYLEELLGDVYTFKETSSHIIITYAPQRMEVVVEIDPKERSKTVISGYVRDLRTEKAIEQASVYDKSFSSSALSNREGYFQLAIKKPEQMVAIVLSKTNYKDTSVTLLLPVEALHFGKKKHIGFYQGYDQEKNLFSNTFGRFFTSSKQRVQSMNLGGIFAYSPIQVSLAPGLGTHGFFNSQIVNNFSLNLIGGSTAGVKGVELAGGLSVNQFDMEGTQVSGILNVVGGHVNGFQMAGAGNVVVRNLKGVQVAGGWNSVDTVKRGFQIAGGINKANNVNGVQVAGVGNVSQDAAHVQIAGGFNKAKHAHGIQVAGLTNISFGSVHSQVAGGVNIAKNVRGFQLAGLLNIADSSDYPIALLSLIKNGQKNLSLQFDESNLTSLQFRSGGRVLYSIIGLGVYADDPDYSYAAEFGLGAKIIDRNKFGFAVEIIQRNNFDNDFRFHSTNRVAFRAVPSYKITPHWSLFAAPAFVYQQAATSGAESKIYWNIWGGSRDKNTLHGGGTVGVTYSF